jgi:hypothetical protein
MGRVESVVGRVVDLTDEAVVETRDTGVDDELVQAEAPRPTHSNATTTNRLPTALCSLSRTGPSIPPTRRSGMPIGAPVSNPVARRRSRSFMEAIRVPKDVPSGSLRCIPRHLRSIVRRAVAFFRSCKGRGRCPAFACRGHRVWTEQAGIANRDGNLATECPVGSGRGVAVQISHAGEPTRFWRSRIVHVGAKTTSWSTRFRRLTDARWLTHNGATWTVHPSSFFTAPRGADLTGQKGRKHSARREHV